MPINFQKFVDWAEDRFPGGVVVSGDEVKINTPWAEDKPDQKHHLYCNPNGGKKGDERPSGVYHCWKSGRKGTLIGLVMEIDHVSPDDALATLEGNLTMEELEAEVAQLLSSEPQHQAPPKTLEMGPAFGLEPPEHARWIIDMPVDGPGRREAERYLSKRRVPVDKFMYCETGRYQDRIVIPYFDRDKRLIYWNTRYIGTNPKALRYEGPPKDIGVGKGDVVYMTRWPRPGEKVYITEGEFCARSLEVFGFNSGAIGGKHMSEAQFAILRDYDLCLCLDNDESGDSATNTIGNFLISQGRIGTTWVRPPVGFKDWNKLHESVSANLGRKYLLDNEKRYGTWSEIDRSLRSI